MERETLLTLLIMSCGGLVLQLLAGWPPLRTGAAGPIQLERRRWRALWYPVAPLLVVAAFLCGWALSESDPVRDPLDPIVVSMLCLPFVLLFVRALARAGWSLLRRPLECGVSTVGLLQPQVIFSPFLAKQLEDGVIRAALAHERAHAVHRDPLRIWVAQLITDLQWPWPAAQQRLALWLDALELARDQEARSEGIDGADLAAAVLASLRYLQAIPCQEHVALRGTQLAHARLIGDSRALRQRISRLIEQLPASAPHGALPARRFGSPAFAVVAVLAGALALGMLYGDRIVHPLLGLSLW